VAQLQQGRIVWIRANDPKGVNAKERPAVVITATEEILPAESFVAVAITTQLPDPLPASYVELPWHRNKHPRTGLKKRCAAKCDWLVELFESDIIGFAGVVPTAKLLEIIKNLPT